MHHLAHRRSGQARRQLFQGKSPQDYAHLLNAGSQKLPKLLLIFGRYLHLKGGVATCPSMGPMIPQKQYIIESFHAVKGLVSVNGAKHPREGGNSGRVEGRLRLPEIPSGTESLML